MYRPSFASGLDQVIYDTGDKQIKPAASWPEILHPSIISAAGF
jgi:hypothetical protein